MRICLVEERFPPHFSGGVSTYVESIAHALARRGETVTVLTTRPRTAPSEDDDTLPFEVVRFAPANLLDPYTQLSEPEYARGLVRVTNLWNPYHLLQVKDILRTLAPEIVHFNAMDNLSVSILDAASSLGLPSVLSLHSLSFMCTRVTGLHSDGVDCTLTSMPFYCFVHRKLMRLLLGSKPTVITAPSHFMLNYYSKMGFFRGLYKEKLPLGVDPSLYGESEGPQREHETFNLLYVGRLSPQKGIDVLMNAFTHVRDPHFQLQIVGWGERANAVQQVATNDRRIRYTGFVNRSELARCFRNADVTVVPSLCKDNAPYVASESLWFGTPVVASRVGGLPELIQDGYSGHLFDPGNAAELSRILTWLAGGADHLQTIKEGIARFHPSLHIDVHVDGLESLYKRAEMLLQ